MDWFWAADCALLDEMDNFNAFAAPARVAAEPAEALTNNSGDHDEENDESEHPDARANDLAKSHAKAIKRLNKHLANPQMVEQDRVARGRRFRSSTAIFTSFAVVLGTISYIRMEMGFEGSDRIWTGIVLFSFVIGAVALMAIISDLISMPKKKKTPLEAMDEFLTALRATRFGYAWMVLSPKARKEAVVAPSLGVLPVNKTSRVLQNPAELEQYIKSFWNSPFGNYLFRSKLALVEEKGDVAIVKVNAIFRREKLWLIVGTAAVLGYFMLELGGLGALLAMYFGGKGHQVGFLKTLIRGSDGYWYMYSGDFFESVNEEPRLTSESK